tara:strand:- start:400 stop:633 length:234 start_codon:yes stop_codon:yes gene_type:complete
VAITTSTNEIPLSKEKAKDSRPLKERKTQDTLRSIKTAARKNSQRTLNENQGKAPSIHVKSQYLNQEQRAAQLISSV